MSRRIRVAVLVAATTLAGGLLGPAPLVAAEGDQHSGLLTEIEAMEQARRTGQPVVASALTDEHTLVTADPETGQLSAELTATIARVRDDHGWREPSTTLIPTGQGTWTAEASALPLTISGGGDGPVVAVGAGAGSAQFTWPASLPTPTIEGDLAIFGEVTPGTDLVVRAAPDGAETFLVVKSAEAAQNPLVRSMPIQIEAPQLTATVEQNGAVSYADGQGQTRLVVPPAYVWDSAGQAPQAPPFGGGPLTPKIAAAVEDNYRRQLANAGQKYLRSDDALTQAERIVALAGGAGGAGTRPPRTTSPGPAENEWAARQAALGLKVPDGRQLPLDEILVYEHLQRATPRIPLAAQIEILPLGKITANGRLPSHDFLWLARENLLVEVKRVKRAEYGVIKKRINDAINDAWRNHRFDKDVFLIDIGNHELRPKLRRSLEQDNQLTQGRKIRRLFVLCRNQITEIKLLKTQGTG